MWTYASAKLSRDVDEKITELIGEREDRSDTTWINLDTGALVALCANGGWRTPESSAFHTLYVSPSGQVVDVTYGLLGRPVPFDTTKHALDSYRYRQDAAIKHIESLLGVSPSTIEF